MNYHSDLDLIFVYDEDGHADGPDAPPNERFFAELAQKVIRDLAGSADTGALYRVDTRLRPYGASGPLAVPLGVVRRLLLRPGGDVGADGPDPGAPPVQHRDVRGRGRLGRSATS